MNCHPEAKDLLCLRHFILFFVLVRFDEKEILACFFGLLVTKYPDIFEEKNQVFKIIISGGFTTVLSKDIDVKHNGIQRM